MNAVFVRENIQNTENLESVDYVRKPVYDVVKRFLDVVCSSFALVVLSPFLACIAIAIYIDDPGPVVFKQVRAGWNMKPFVIYKFRTMTTNAEHERKKLMEQNEDQGANFKITNDPRVTRVGKWLRKCSADELLQLCNILKGDMSIIGPRPFIEDEQKELPEDRLLVKPGLSCYWQISGKNNLPKNVQIELDRRYIRERSFLVDTKIVAKTILSVLGMGNK